LKVQREIGRIALRQPDLFMTRGAPAIADMITAISSGTRPPPQAPSVSRFPFPVSRPLQKQNRAAGPNTHATRF
jgi:hypothetical protein